MFLPCVVSSTRLDIEVRNCENFSAKYDVMESLEPLGLLRKVHRIECSGCSKCLVGEQLSYLKL
jgi:hypothetical protein